VGIYIIQTKENHYIFAIIAVKSKCGIGRDNMREIKFRAWDKHNKIMMTIFDSIAQSEWYIPNMKNGNYEYMQFTGLHDKNGKEVYEGDICLIGDEGFAKPMQIIFEDGCFGVHWTDGHFAELKYYIVYPSCEVIGNIYENPELLVK
jgi:uncharacterized phage protein (TIGR01671 family)